MGTALLFFLSCNPVQAATLRPGRASPEPIQKVAIAVNQAKMLQAKRRVIRAESGNNGVVLVTPGFRGQVSVQIRGRGRGITNVLLWQENGEIRNYRVTVR